MSFLGEGFANLFDTGAKPGLSQLKSGNGALHVDWRGLLFLRFAIVIP
jgi:hypothetical protein